MLSAMQDERSHRDDASLTESQGKLLEGAWHMTCRVIRAGQRQFHVEAHEVFVCLVDIRGKGGRIIATWALGEESVAARLARTGTDRIVPLAIPLTVDEGAVIINDFVPRLSSAYATRPLEAIPILIIDRHNQFGLTFKSSTSLLAQA